MHSKSTNDWCFHLDSDEIMSQNNLLGLRELIESNQNNKIDVFGFTRLNYLNNVLVNDIPRNLWNKENLERIRNEQLRNVA